MLANLIENAMKHSPKGAIIALLAARTPKGISLVLTDTEPGIPAAERSRVFRRFYRLRTTPGSGLGLSLAYAVASLHKISVELAENHPGLRVTLRFSRPPIRPTEPLGLVD
jgi:signal transduction histidine kinase